MPPTSFSSLNLREELINNLTSLSYHSMTAIQAKSLPDILAGHDVIGQGKTGSGKTAAFGLGLLQKLKVTDYRIQVLVLCPTRELADQVSKEIRRLARQLANVKVLTLCGGMPFGPQFASLEHGAHIIVGTPGRIEDHLSHGSMHLDQVNTLVLDEADRMLDMGFQAAVEHIIDQIPKWRQTLLFSATFPDQIKAISKRIMLKPVMVRVESSHDSDNIAQHFYQLDDDAACIHALHALLIQYSPRSSIIFCNTKKETLEISRELGKRGFSALALNGDLEQWERDQTMIRFANKSISILVATDVAARGLDIEALDAVFNVQLPHEPETYVHRIGRTGRAGSKGNAFTLHYGNEYKLTILSDYIQRPIQNETLPDSSLLHQHPEKPLMSTLQVGGGKKQKLRPGDILGALTGGSGISAHQVGKIHILDQWAYVAVNQSIVKSALKKLGGGTLKGRSFRVRKI